MAAVGGAHGASVGGAGQALPGLFDPPADGYAYGIESFRDRKAPAVIRPNPLKEKLRRGEAALGCWNMTAHAISAEILALSGYDAVMLDHEHGPGDFQSAVACLQALHGHPPAALLRVPWNDPVYIKRALDIGIEGIMIPSINSAEEAEAAVAACRYPPRGIRGWAASTVRASGYGAATQDYLETAERELLIILQIETIHGAAAIPEIAEVEGVDMLFIGPNDFSGSLGKPGRFDDPEVREAILNAEQSIRASGRWLGTIASLGRTPRQMAEAGCNLILGSSDMVLLRQAAQAEVAAFRQTG